MQITWKSLNLRNIFSNECDACSIWYDLYNLKNVKNTYGGVLPLGKLQASINCSKSRKASQIATFPKETIYKLDQRNKFAQRQSNRSFPNSNQIKPTKNSEKYFNSNFCPIEKGITYAVKIDRLDGDQFLFSR